jgi:hypothetical protein
MSGEDRKDFYSNIKDLAKDSANLTFQLLKDRVLRFDINRTLEINTFLLNYFLVQNYFPAFDIQDDLANTLTEDQASNFSLFREYVERLHGLFILIPMKYKEEDPYTRAQTDNIINNMDAYGEFTNQFFSAHENLTNIKIDSMLEFLNGFAISYNFLPDLDFDPEFQEVTKSEAIQQLFYVTLPKEYFYKHNIVRFKYTIDEALKKEYDYNIHDWDKKLFNFNPELKMFKSYLINAANYIAVPDFGSKKLMSEVIEKFKRYYCLRVESLKNEISDYLDCFRGLFELVEGKMYKKLSWNTFKKKLKSISNEESVSSFLESFCLNKTYISFPKTIKDFRPRDFISVYNDYLKYACYYYMGSVYTGAFLIWRAMLKYFEELQKTDRFKKKKGILLENWCLRQIQENGFMVEKIILRNKNLEPSDNYRAMKNQIESFDKEPLEFEVDFIDHQKKYSFNEIDLAFREEGSLYLIECKGRAIQFSETEKYFAWAKKFKSIYELLKKKLENLAYNLEKGKISHPLFTGVDNLIPIVLQTEGVFLRSCTFTPYEFSEFLKHLKKKLDNVLEEI